MGRRRGTVVAKGGRFYGVASFTNGGKRYRPNTRACDTRQEAEVELTKLLASIDANPLALLQDGNPKVLGDMTLDEVLWWWMERTRPLLAKQTAKQYESAVRNMAPRVASIEVRHLSPDDLQRLVNTMASELSLATIRNYLKVVVMALEALVDRGILDKNPARGLKYPKDKRVKLRYWTKDEVQIFLQRSKGHHYHALYRLAIASGLRRGELLALRWRYVGDGFLRVVATLQEDGTITTTKTRHSQRTVTLDPTTLATLAAHRATLHERYQGPDDLVFQSPRRPGKPMTASMPARELHELARAYGLPDLTFHDLRHTHATLLLSSGIHPRIVQERLGHSNVGITLDTYSHVVPSLQATASQAIEGILG